MSDRILLPLPDGRWIALHQEAFDIALALGRELMASPATSLSTNDTSTGELLDAEAIAKLFHLKRSWLLERARLNEIPHVRLGKYVRFDASAIHAHLARGPDTRIVNPQIRRKSLNGKHP